MAAASERNGTRHAGAKRPAADAAPSAPSMMPAFITDVTSVRTLALSAAACAGAAQYGQCATSMPSAIAICAPHSANAPVTPHGLPEIASVAMLTSASAAPPATSGHGP